jgi:hypothetical protein
MATHGNTLRPYIHDGAANKMRTWKRVFVLCTRNTRPSRVEVKAVLPPTLYSKYEKNRKQFREHRAFELRPQNLESITKDINSLSRKIRSAKGPDNADALKKLMRDFDRALKGVFEHS